jgi:hypothetical protein
VEKSYGLRARRLDRIETAPQRPAGILLLNVLRSAPKLHRFVEGKIDGHWAVVGNWLRQAIVQVGERLREVGRKNIRPMWIAWILQVRLHKNPVELEFGDSHFAPDEFCHKSWSESVAQALIGVGQSAGLLVDRSCGETPEIDGLAVRKRNFSNVVKSPRSRLADKPGIFAEVGSTRY